MNNDYDDSYMMTLLLCDNVRNIRKSVTAA
jgi:hypothetical protein